MGTTINDLPLEVVEIICLHLWSTDLAQVSSVCHKWHQAVGTKPFKKVDFATEKSLARIINFLEGSSFPYGSLIENVHFGIIHVFITGTFVVNVHKLFYYCPNVQFISSNKVLSTTVLQSLSSLPADIELSRLKAIPVNSGLFYNLCAKKFNQSLMELDLRNHVVSDKEILLGHNFLSLKRLSLGSTDRPFDLIDSVLMKNNHLDYLSFHLINSRFGTSLSATDKYPSLLELKILFKAPVFNADHIALNTFLFRFVNLERLTASIFDTINDNQPPDQLYAFRDFIAWANTVYDSKICIKNFRPENLLTYLKYICNTIPPHKKDWKTKVAFLRSSYFLESFISYSTHTGYRERTFAITLDNYFARNFMLNYLNKLQMPFTVWIQ